jgi:predicted dehydrogenase
MEELEEIKKAYSMGEPGKDAVLMVGFNRRFSSLTGMLKARLGPGPVSMIYRINAGSIPADSWIQDKEIGGGRITGEVCHFVDYLTFLCGSPPRSVYGAVMKDPLGLGDTVNVSLSFEDGSIGTISYFANGSVALPKEYLEVYSSGTTGILKDFRELEIYGGKGRDLRKKLLSQDKGQKNMVVEFLTSIIDGKPSPISFEEICVVTLATLKITESIQSGQSVRIEEG